MQLTDPRRAPDADLLDTEREAALARAIGDLPEAEQEVVVLRLSGDRSFPAIARALSIPEGTAKTRMRSGLARLRLALADYDPTASVTEELA